LGWSPTVDATEGVNRLCDWIETHPGLFEEKV
jgi:hypothetical protein